MQIRNSMYLHIQSLSAEVLMKSAMSAAKATRTPMKPWEVGYSFRTRTAAFPSNADQNASIGSRGTT